MNARLVRVGTAVAGLAGTAVLAAGTVVPALVYRGRQGQAYSVLNHFISELGELGVSERAATFNGCLLAGGLLVAAFMAGLGHHLRTRLGRLAALVGTVAGVAAGVVGLVPMNDLWLHLAIANVFFYGGLAAVGMFTAAIWKDPERRLPRALAAPGVAAGLCFVAFLVSPPFSGMSEEFITDPDRFVRPAVMWVAFFEWTVLWSVCAWVVLGAGALLAFRERREP